MITAAPVPGRNDKEMMYNRISESGSIEKDRGMRRKRRKGYDKSVYFA